MPTEMIVALISAVSGVLASSGLWTFFGTRSKKNKAFNKLVMGLAYDKIVTVGAAYINRGWVSKDEFEDYVKYLVEPYQDLGGNGVAEKIGTAVKALPFHTVPFKEIVLKENPDADH